MNGLFFALASRALGKGPALRALIRSRYEPEGPLEEGTQPLMRENEGLAPGAADGGSAAKSESELRGSVRSGRAGDEAFAPPGALGTTMPHGEKASTATVQTTRDDVPAGERSIEPEVFGSTTRAGESAPPAIGGNGPAPPAGRPSRAQTDAKDSTASRGDAVDGAQWDEGTASSPSARAAEHAAIRVPERATPLAFPSPAQPQNSRVGTGDAARDAEPRAHGTFASPRKRLEPGVTMLEPGVTMPESVAVWQAPAAEGERSPGVRSAGRGRLNIETLATGSVEASRVQKVVSNATRPGHVGERKAREPADERRSAPTEGEGRRSAEASPARSAPRPRPVAPAEPPPRQRDRAFHLPRAKPPAEASPQRVTIQIGRIEVRAVPAEPLPAPAPRGAPGLSLDAYLQRLEEKGR
jgi:hypothetical protein